MLIKQTNLNKKRNKIQYLPKNSENSFHQKVTYANIFFSAVTVSVIQKRVTQNFMRKTRIILKTWSLRIPQTEQGNIPKWFPAEETLKKKQLYFMAPFYGWGSTASMLEPLQGDSLLFTTKFR